MQRIFTQRIFTQRIFTQRTVLAAVVALSPCLLAGSLGCGADAGTDGGDPPGSPSGRDGSAPAPRDAASPTDGEDGGAPAPARPFDECGIEPTDTCVSAPRFASGAERERFGNRDAERAFDLDFAEVSNSAGRFFTQDIWDRGSPGEHERITADRDHLYFQMPARFSGSNGNDAATGATFHFEVAPTTRATLSYKVRFQGAGFDGAASEGGAGIQRTPCAGDADGVEVHNDENICMRGGKLPGLGIGDDPRTGCRHAPDGGSFRVMFQDMDGGDGPNPPEFISYTYTQGTNVLGDPEEGIERGSTPDPDDRCGTERSLDPPVFVQPETWYRVEVEVDIEDVDAGTGHYGLRVFGCDAAGEACEALLGSLRRPADFLDGGERVAVTQLLMHAYLGGARTDPHWRLPEDGEIVITDVTYTAHVAGEDCPTYCR